MPILRPRKDATFIVDYFKVDVRHKEIVKEHVQEYMRPCARNGQSKELPEVFAWIYRLRKTYHE